MEYSGRMSLHEVFRTAFQCMNAVLDPPWFQIFACIYLHPSLGFTEASRGLLWTD
jgi:hypothetical protein